MPYYLAIDAGGSKTQCLLADSDRVLARAATGSIKLQRVGEQEATTRLASMLAELSAAASIPLTHITRTCIGLAGLTIPAVRAWATQALSAQVSGDLLLLGDEEIALEAAFPDAPGILLIAGTGSHAIGRGRDSTLHRAGGWGPILGDEGGGYWIGLEALRSALRFHHSSRHNSESPLLQAIQRHWNLASLAELVEFANRSGDPKHQSPDFASLAPVVARCAAEADPIAADVLARAGEQLANLIGTVADHLAHANSASPHPTEINPAISVAFTGSVLEHIPPVQKVMAAALERTLPGARLTKTPVDPLEGALYRARHH